MTATAPLSNIDIAQRATMKPIVPLGMERLGIPEEHLHPFGRYKAKLALDYCEHVNGRPDGKLVLVTAMSPTPAGEGKTTMTVGLGDALNRIGKKADHLPARASARPGVRYEGRRGGRRLRAGRPDGGHQPAFHR